MRSIFVIAAALALAVVTAQADDTSWVRQWTPGGVRVVGGMVRCQGSDAFVCGTLNDTVGTNSDVYAVKYTGTGDLAWARVWNFAAQDAAPAVAAGPSEIYLLVRTHVQGQPFGTKVARLSPAGDTAWTRARPTSQSRCVVANPAGGCWVFGSIGPQPPRDSLWFGRYDGSGNYTLHKTLRLVTTGQLAAGLCQTSDGGLVGAANLTDTSGPVACLVKYLAAGDTVWTRRLASTFAMMALAVATGPSGDFYFLGSATSGTVLARMNPAGDTVWTVAVSSAGAVAADLASDSAGNVYVAAVEAGDVAVFKFDAQGQLVSLVSGGSPSTDIATSLAVGADLGPIVTGAVGNLAALTVKFAPPVGIASPSVPSCPAGLRLLGTLGSGRALLAVPQAGRYGLALFSADGRQLARSVEFLEPGLNEVELAAGRASGVRYLIVEGPAGTSRFKLVRAE